MKSALAAGLLILLIAGQSQSVEIEQLYRGAWLELTRNAAEKIRFSPSEKSEQETFRQWYEIAGRPVALKSRAGEPLTPEEAPFEWLARAGYMYEALHNEKAAPEGAREYVQQTLCRATNVLRNGYSGCTLTDEEIRHLRDYCLYTEIKRTRARVLPFEFGFTTPAVEPGSEAPDFPLIPLEDALKSPAYSDAVCMDYTAFIKPGGIDKFTRLFAGYRSNGTIIEPKPFTEADGAGRLSSLRGKKPVVLIFANASDVFWRVCLPAMEPLVQAFGDQIQFYHVNISYHDTFSSSYDFYGTGGNGFTVNRWSSVPEDRARQAKIQYMTNPNVTLECLMDDPYARIRNLYGSEGGSANYYLIDLDGRIAFKSAAGWFYWTNGPYPDSVLWLNDMERAIHALLARGGRTGSSAVTESSAKTGASRPFFKNRTARNYGGEIKNALWYTGTITAIDPGKKTVTVQSARLNPEMMKGWRFIQQDRSRIKIPAVVQPCLPQLEKWIRDGETGQPRTFQLGDSIELFLNGQEAEPADFKAGDHVGVKFAPAAETNGLIQPEIFRASRL